MPFATGSAGSWVDSMVATALVDDCVNEGFYHRGVDTWDGCVLPQGAWLFEVETTNRELSTRSMRKKSGER